MAEMVPIDDFLCLVRPYAATAPEPSIVRCLREVARDYCAATFCWRETDRFTIAGREEPVFIPADSEIVTIDEARLDGRRLEPVSLDWLDQHRPGWREENDEAAPARWITQLQPDALMVVPFVAGQLSVRLTLKPSLDAESLPSFLMSQFGEVIGKGAAGSLLMTPGEWANPQLGAFLSDRFAAVLAAGKVIAAKGQQRAPLRTRPRYF